MRLQVILYTTRKAAKTHEEYKKFSMGLLTNTVTWIRPVQKNKDGRYLEIKGPKPSVLWGGVYCRANTYFQVKCPWL